MLLAIDIGNTHIVGAVFKGPNIMTDWRVPTSDVGSTAEATEHVRGRLAAASIDPAMITTAGISSVVPSATPIFAEMTQELLHIQAMVIDSSLDLGISIRYDDPKAVGADRICNAVAGFNKYGGPLIIVDFGTATTYDIVAKNGDYLGGVIAPGIETSAADLHRRAARLPRIVLRLPPSVIGRDTESSMQAGILYGAIDALEGMVRRLSKAIETTEGKRPTVIGTGGFSEFLSEQTNTLEHIEPRLVLDGIRIICSKMSE